MLKIECQTVSYHWCMKCGSGGTCAAHRDRGALRNRPEPIIVGVLGKKAETPKVAIDFNVKN